MKQILVPVLAILLVGALSACGTTPAPMPADPTPETPVANEENPTDAVDAVLSAAVDPPAESHHAKSGNRYPEELRRAFLNECVPDGGAQPCECVLNKMEQEYTVADIGAKRVTQDDIKRWTASCVGVAPAEPAYTPYPTEVRNAFLNECSPSGGAATCECVLQKMEREIPLERLAKNDVPKELLAGWVQQCLGQ